MNKGIIVKRALVGDLPTDDQLVTNLVVEDVNKNLEPGDDEVLLDMKNVGICGSDVHYWTHGRGARFRVDKQMVLGHEGSGRVAKIGKNVKHLKVGDAVSFEPGYPIGSDEFTKSGKYNLSNVFFCATPPDDGCLCKQFVHKAAYCYKMPPGMSYELGALIEPLSVGVHAARRANIDLGHRVLITGAGPIGMVSAIAARAKGACEIWMTDVIESRLELARSMGINTINVTNQSEAYLLAKLGKFDAVIECTGRVEAVRLAIYAAKPGSTVVLVGLGQRDKLYSLPITHAAVNEIDIRGVFRYRNTWPAAIAIAQRYEAELKALVSHRFTIDQAKEAFDLAKSGACMKVMFEI